jgi:hypothetical protein
MLIDIPQEPIMVNEQSTGYPVHYHGYIKYFDPTVPVVDKQLDALYGEDADLLGVG